jgi:hypothetical protein
MPSLDKHTRNPGCARHENVVPLGHPPALGRAALPVLPGWWACGSRNGLSRVALVTFRVAGHIASFQVRQFRPRQRLPARMREIITLSELELR